MDRTHKFPGIVPKLRQALTFLATFKIDHDGHANAGRHLDSRTADDLRRCLYGPASDERAARDDATAGELTPVVGAGVGDKKGRTMLSVDQFLRLISVPAVFLAFHIATQVTGG